MDREELRQDHEGREGDPEADWASSRVRNAGTARGDGDGDSGTDVSAVDIGAPGPLAASTGATGATVAATLRSAPRAVKRALTPDRRVQLALDLPSAARKKMGFFRHVVATGAPGRRSSCVHVNFADTRSSRLPLPCWARSPRPRYESMPANGRPPRTSAGGCRSSSGACVWTCRSSVRARPRWVSRPGWRARTRRCRGRAAGRRAGPCWRAGRASAGCGAGASVGTGGGVKWVGRNVRGGPVPPRVPGQLRQDALRLQLRRHDAGQPRSDRALEPRGQRAVPVQVHERPVRRRASTSPTRARAT